MRADETLLDVLVSAAHEAPDQVIVQVDGDGSEQVQTYSQLLEDSLTVAGGFRAAGVPVGSPVILLPGRSDDFLPAFWGALAAGLVPVPLAPVPEKVLAVWGALHEPPIVVTDVLEPLVHRCFVEAGSPGTLDLLSLSRLRTGVPVTDPHRAAPEDLAFLQFSSGSTSAPKGVELTHANVVTNIVQTRTAGAATASDVMVTWLPYFHDMGLIGAHLAPMSVRIKQVKLEPHDFAKRPALWYETAVRHRGTLLPMASFALALTLSRVPSEEVAAWDLSCVRLMGVGAEPIPVRAWRQFLDHLRPAGLDPSAVVPLYGLAEATVAVTFPPLGELAVPLVLDRRQLSQGRAVDASLPHAAGEVAEFLDVGRPVPGGQLRIVGDDGALLADDAVGTIEFRGPNVARGYHADPTETASTFAGGWLRTGDVGFLRNGRLCVTGRAKDVLFIHGQKYHAHDVEQVVAATPGLPSGRVAVVGCADLATGAERVAVFVTSPTGDANGMAETVRAVTARVREALAYDDVRVLPIASHEFPRTTSGKLQRARLRERFGAGEFPAQDAPAAPVPVIDGARVSTPTSRLEVEARITAIWSEVLGVPATTIGREDRFLAIGGSSLAAMHVLGRLEGAFGGPLEPAVMRDCATVAALAAHVLGARNAPLREAHVAVAGQGSDGSAVIGVACRFPDADTPDAFWSNLASGRDSVSRVPTSRWDSPPGTPARWGAFLDDVAGFDAGFFGIGSAEAEVMDPHARIFLEVAHEALERAGYAGARRQSRRVGVFVAVGESGYGQLLHRVLDSGATVSPAALVGNLRNLIAARVAHCLDLSGPAIAVDTACSSSLVALHLARRSLEAGECDVAVVGGVSLNLTATSYQLLEAAQALSPTGRSRAFSSGADGFVPGEGAAALVLEPLAAARPAGDRVLAVVRGSAVNNDGRSLSLMAPNPLLQEAVIADAYRDAGIDPATVSYVEAHGTGTAIGDPIEARSLMRTFRPGTTPRWVGSVKTNVGHLLNAAGMPSLLKVVLALHHRQLPASLHCSEPSPEFDLASAGMEVVTQLRDWTASGPRRAGINGFGFGGTNVHVIIEEAPPVDRPAVGSRTPGPHLLTVSAATPEALQAAVADLAVHVRAHPDLDTGDLCYSAATARDDGRHRLALVAGGDLAGQLESRRGSVAPPARQRPRLALVFTGQGSQVAGMGRAMHEAQPVYRRTFTGLSESVGPIEGRSLLEWSLDVDADAAELAQTAVAQPLLVAFGIAVGAQLRDWGVRADAMLGHSVGELAAAAVSGALTAQDAVRLAVERGRLMQDHCGPGAMAAVIGAEAEVRAVLASTFADLSVAALNGPHVVISGPCAVIDEAVSALAGHGLLARRLPVSRAFHSALMTPALEGLRTAAGSLTPQPQQTPLLSSVTGTWTPTFDASYLVSHAVEPVLFGPCVQRLLDDGYDTFLEVGPDATLSSLVRSIVRDRADRPDVDAFSVTDPRVRDGAALTRAVGRLWERGVTIRQPAQPGRPRVELPTYPFQRRRYWLPDVITRAPVGHAADRPVSSALHRFAWHETPLPAGSVLREAHITGADSGTARALASRLTRRGVSVQHTASAELGERPEPSVVIAFAGPAVVIDCVQQLDVLARHASATILDLARELENGPTPLIVVTEDVAFTGNGAERVRPGHAILAGLAKTLSEESAGQAVRIVDLSSHDDEAARIDSLIRELDAPPGSATAAESVAWRHGRRLAQAPLFDEVLEPDRPATLAPDGAYLITGGAGGIGAEVARALARRGRPALFLVGRSATCPPPLIAELRDLGARVHYVAADLSTEPDVDTLADTLPPLDGVFHAAGVVRPGWLRSASVAQVEQVLAPKVRGTFLLARALDRTGRRPKTFVAFSSIASTIPGYAGGLGAYTAANAFLDAFVLAENAAGRPMQVLNFAAWADTGMADSAVFRTGAAANGVPQLSVEQALQALFDATTRSDPQLLVLDTATTSPAPTSTAPAAPADARHSATASTGLREVIAGLVAARLDQPAATIDADASFLAMGLDSLTAVDLVKELEHALGRSLPTTLLFEHSSIATLSEHLSITPAQEQRPDVAQQQGGAAFPLTPVQLAFHTTGRLHPGLAAYAYLRLSIAGEVDEPLLARSMASLERRHPMLRLRIQPGDGEPRQVIGPLGAAERPDWFEARDLDSPIEGAEDELCNRVFDLAHEPPVRALLARDEAGRASLLICLHHAAADGASLNVLCEELWQVYTAMHLRKEPELRELRTVFRDQVDAVEKLRTSEEFADDCRYWRERLAVGPAQGRLPYDGDPSAPPCGPLTARQFATTTPQTAVLQARAAELDVSLFHLVLSAYVRRLADWGGHREVTVNVARAGREARLPDVDRVVGPFADTLPLTVMVPETDDTPALTQEVRAAWLESEQHARVTSLDLARMMPTGGAAPRTVGAASFSFARFPVTTPAGCPVEVDATAARTASAATRLSLVCWEFDKTLQFSWNYPAHLFRPQTIERLTVELLAELTSVAGAAPAPPGEPSVTARIRSQCRRTPEALAVDAGGRCLTYAQLDASSGWVAASLGRLGVRRGDRVVLLTAPGQHSVVGLLGILRAGAAWVPLDAAHPEQRLADQAAIAGASAIVCDASTRQVAERLGRPGVVDLDAPSAYAYAAADAPDPVTGEQDVAYVIFTSGTTGRPKGVPITHHALTTYLDWAVSTFGYGSSDRMIATAPICFDASVRQLLAPLLVGATIVTVSSDVLRDPQALLATVADRRVSVWSSVPTLWAALLRAAESAPTTPDLSALRWVHVGGEALSPALVRRWFDLFGPEQRVVNLYGPTEATINATFEVIASRPDDDLTRLPIGRPVAKTVVDIVGPDGEACLPGEAGELLVAGPGVTPGYLAEPGSDAAFVHRRGTRYYRTGDRAVLRNDGKLEFLGRMDRQLKIRGHRVEPAEIDLLLQDRPGVERVVTVPVEGPAGMRLVAYVQTPADRSDCDAEELRCHVAGRLPDYMVPAEIRLVDQLPLTPAGKLDTASLHAAAASARPAGRTRAGTAAATDTERILATVWSELLGVEPVFREDDFFVLGGDSIAVLEVFARLEVHRTSLPPPTAMYRHRTLSRLAAAVDAVASVLPAPSRLPAAAGPFALTPAQRGFLLAEALAPGARSSWLACFRLAGRLDVQLLQQAVDRLVERHLMLRVRFATDQRPPVQVEVPSPADLPVHFESIEPGELDDRIREERGHRFDSSSWPLVRLRLLRLGTDAHALVVHAHHLIGDGYSVVVLGQDLMRLYDRLAAGHPPELPPLRSTFRDYAELVHHSADGSATTPAEPYSPPVLHEAGATSRSPCLTERLIVERDLASDLRRVAASDRATPYAPLLTAYYRALARRTGRSDLLLGVTVTGRDHALPDLARMVGPFATILPVRVRAGGLTARAQLHHIASAVTEARAAGTTMQQLAGTSTAGTRGLPSLGAQFLFSHLDFDALGPMSGETVSVTWDEAGTELEPPPIGTDLLLTVRPSDGRLHLTLRTASGIMGQEELRRFADILLAELAELAGPSQQVPRSSSIRRDVLDAALVGYLPAPSDLAALAGIPTSDGLRHLIRKTVFPDGQPRLLEDLATPVGRSGFVCLPLFADELSASSGDSLAGDSARAIELAGSLGARCVSLAGLLSARTAYGFTVVRAVGPAGPRVTTGHAATAASVVKTTIAALSAAGRTLDGSTLACVGLGSIGRSSLELLLSVAAGAPHRLVLCDVASRSRQLADLAAQLTERGFAGDITLCSSDASMPATAYQADLVIAASSADREILDVSRLRPGTIVVDDSFPHCFDPSAAIERMQRQGDVLVVGGGLLSCRRADRAAADDVATLVDASRWLDLRPGGTVASCQLESLLQADRPGLPVVHGLVDVGQATAYWEAMADVDVTAAPLHLLAHVLTPEFLEAFAQI